MDTNHKQFISAVVVGTVMSLLTLGIVRIYFWPSTETTAQNLTPTPASGTANIPEAPPPKPVGFVDPSPEWDALKLPRASGRASGPPQIGSVRPPLQPAQVRCPMSQGLSIDPKKPDFCCTWEIVGRTTETFGLMQFDLSAVNEPPKQAMLRASVYYMENTRGFQTPLKLVFYRMKTEWDDTATFRHASSRSQVEWKKVTGFSPGSAADVDLTPVATVTVPNPPAAGYNLVVDITPVVAGWVKGEYPNHGLLMCCDFGVGRSTQGNLATRKYTTSFLPEIVCTVSSRPAPATQPAIETGSWLKSAGELLGN